MLRVQNRAELARLKGEVPKPAPAVLPAPDVGAPSIAALQASMEKLAAQVEQSAQIMAAAAQARAQDKKLEAVVHRDQHGRMQSVTITVKQEK